MGRIGRLLVFVRHISAWLALSGADSQLALAGWLRSWRHKRPLDAAGRPIPWMTYSGLAFLESRVRQDMAVFEFGCGSSTLWWAAKVKSVVSVEHDREWFERTRSQAPQAVELVHAPLEGQQYASEVLKYRDAFDIVVIDGRDRVNCARNCLVALKPHGVVVWDNADRDSYQAGYDFLLANGFRRIDFWGMGPINVYSWCTAVFYRPGNCFGL